MGTIFNYHAKNQDGKNKEGIIEALTEKDALNKLHGNGLFVVSMRTIEEETLSELALNVKYCRQCFYAYDDSWKLCLDCNIPLVQKAELTKESREKQAAYAPGNTTESASAEQMKKCSFCMQDIRVAAIKCPYCNEVLSKHDYNRARGSNVEVNVFVGFALFFAVVLPIILENLNVETVADLVVQNLGIVSCLLFAIFLLLIAISIRKRWIF